MAETAQFTIGAAASCLDGVCGEVSRVVVDPVARAVTHLVVEPRHPPGLGRLVPLDLVDAAAGQIRLHCTISAFGELELAEETRFLQGTGGYLAYSPGHVLSWPYYSLGGGVSLGTGVGLDLGLDLGEAPQAATYDRVPLGEVAIRRGEHVHAKDGDIGRVQGLVIGRHDRHVTHVLLQEGHLWGRKEVAIPIGAVAGVGDGIRLRLTKQEVQDLPPVDVDYPGG